MKRVWPIFVLFLISLSPAAADSPWYYSRIVDVNKTVNTRTKVWVVNTPITEDEISYTISVHVQDKIIIGTYDLTPEGSIPPEEWTTNYPLKVQVLGNRLYLRSPTGTLTLRIIRRKDAKPMMPLTVAEKKQLEEIEAPAGSLVGFTTEKDGANTQKETEAPPAPAPAPPPSTMGLVNVRSMPYLSEVFVDGDSMGYTPAKVSLLPGKHSFRVEKPGFKSWTKEITITTGSELTLDAILEKK